MTSASEPTSGSIPRPLPRAAATATATASVPVPATDASTVRMRRAAANVVWLLHVGIVATVMLAGLLPFETLWWLILALAPIMQIQWWANRNRCVLTTLEHRLREATPGAAAARPTANEIPAPEDTFVGRLLGPFVGELSNRAIDGIATGVLWLAFLVCSARIGLG